MSEERKKILVIGLLAVVVLVLVYQFVIKGSGGAPAPASSGAPGTTPPPLAANAPPTAVDLDLDALEAGIRRVDFVYRNEKIERDPMTPVRPILGDKATPGTADPRINVKMQKIYDMKVTGIIYSELRPMAIIDDELVTVGREYGDGVRIVAIDRDTVWFESDNARVPLKFKEQ